MTTIRYRVRFGRPERPMRRPRPRSDAALASVPEPPLPKRPDPRASAARLLAVPHFVERGLIDGSIESFEAAAELVGVSGARLSQIMRLLDLAPTIHERVVRGAFVPERALRRQTLSVDWRDQLRFS